MPGRSRSDRAILFAIFCAACLTIVALYAFNAIQRSRATAAASAAADAPAPPEVLARIVSQPHLVFLHSPSGDTYRRVAVVPLDAVDGPRFLTPLQCQRVSFRADQGLCLGSNSVAGVPTKYNAFGFDGFFQVQATYDQPGVPIRARVSNDGRVGATTVFVTGHSYADLAFSTQTDLVDTKSGAIVADLEQLKIDRGGEPFQSVDFNFWGVTFARDNDEFYATLGTGGKTYLIEARVSTRQGRVLAENVECPSLSPDNKRLVFKQRKSNDTRTWRLATMDLDSLAVSAVPGESRSVDDQVEWLDDGHILYGLQAEGSIATDVWLAPLDGSEQPRVFLHDALSPSVVR